MEKQKESTDSPKADPPTDTTAGANPNQSKKHHFSLFKGDVLEEGGEAIGVQYAQSHLREWARWIVNRIPAPWTQDKLAKSLPTLATAFRILGPGKSKLVLAGKELLQDLAQAVKEEADARRVGRTILGDKVAVSEEIGAAAEAHRQAQATEADQRRTGASHLASALGPSEEAFDNFRQALNEITDTEQTNFLLVAASMPVETLREIFIQQRPAAIAQWIKGLPRTSVHEAPKVLTYDELLLELHIDPNLKSDQTCYDKLLDELQPEQAWRLRKYVRANIHTIDQLRALLLYDEEELIEHCELEPGTSLLATAHEKAREAYDYVSAKVTAGANQAETWAAEPGRAGSFQRTEEAARAWFDKQKKQLKGEK